MSGDDDEYSVFGRLWEMVFGRLDFIVPLKIIGRPETLSILDYRPTFWMFLTAAGTVLFAVLFIFFIIQIRSPVDSFMLWVTAVGALVCLGLSFRGTIREVYFFDRPKDSYTFIRQFMHRREVIEGSLSQFTGAYVKTEKGEDSDAYFVVLNQDGMFLTGVSEQTLREEVPIFNSFNNESRIADAISGFLSSKG